MNLHMLDSILRGWIIINLIACFFIWLYSAIRFKGHYRYAIAPLLYTVHATLFVVLSITDVLSKDVYTIWRDILFIHGTLLLVVIGCVFIEVMRTRE